MSALRIIEIDGQPFLQSTVERPFNWLTVLRLLDVGTKVDNEFLTQLNSRAGAWPTCACGALCAQIPKYENGVPLDSRLVRLGIAFSIEVSSRNWRKALETFEQIEKRSSYLLMLAKDPAAV